MDINATEEDFAKWIGETLRVPVEEKDNQFVYNLSSLGIEDVSVIEKNVFTQYIQRLQGMNSPEEMILTDNTSYEVLLREESPFPRFRTQFRDETSFTLEDQDNSVKYFLSSPSNEYILFLLYKVSSISSPRALARRMPKEMLRRAIEETTDIFDLLRRAFLRFITLRLESGRNRTVAEFEKFSSAYLFQLSYSLNASLVPQRHLDEILRTGKIAQIRRSNINEIEPPRRHYIPDLIYHYQLAVASDNPFLEFLSYYHVIEHFFEEVFNEDLVERIKNKITHPDFSYKRKKDISSLIKDISSSLPIRNEKVIFNEQEGLRLTLQRYVNIVDLREQIADYDSDLVDYYRSAKVLFAAAGEVDLHESDVSVIFKKLAARIYKIRNSIVHSKESDKARYTPFRDDRILIKEVPLLRFISEQIIINTSELIE